MKAVICLCALVVAAIARPEDKYTSKYDNLNIQEILSNKKLLGTYCKCILDLDKCTAEGKELKSHIKEALETHCAKCTEKQKEYSRLIILHLIKHEPEYWRQITQKYDPDGKFAVQYEAEVTTSA